ncbi:DUF6471 domain-containing protein [Acidithiobacillus ferriphilus]|uniref:DUF6471 domain-containing protein n=1 Tax=Acidithiobacillus ferriphilus TaxID=1689834 RepID=UPI00405653EB
MYNHYSLTERWLRSTLVSVLAEMGAVKVDEVKKGRETHEDAPWYPKAANMLKGEMLRHRVSAVMLSKMLRGVGVNLGPNALSNKIRRGSFTFAFFLQCMHVMRVQQVDFYMASAPIVSAPPGKPMQLIDDDEPAFE